MASVSNETPHAHAVHRDGGLAGLIHPVGLERFDREYREQQPLVIKRDDPGFYAHLLTLADMDRILATMSVPETTIRLISAGSSTSLTPLTSRRPGQVVEALYGQYRNGATINVLYLHERWPPLALLCRALAAELTATVQTNVYLTPRCAQGLKPHHDTHDVFVAQIHGVKHWRLYMSAARLPLSRHGRPEPGYAPGAPVREFDLEPGDLLYLPRGLVHDATSAEAASLHLTIGVSPLTWGGILQLAVNEALKHDIGLRTALPLAIAGDGWQQAVNDRVAALLGALCDRVDAVALITQARRALLDGSAPQLDGHLLDLEAVHSLDLDTPVRRRAGMSHAVTAENGTVSLAFHGKNIRLPGRLAPQVHFVSERATLTGRSIPGPLDEAGRLVLLRTLLREGFLTQCPPDVTPGHGKYSTSGDSGTTTDGAAGVPYTGACC